MDQFCMIYSYTRYLVKYKTDQKYNGGSQGLWGKGKEELLFNRYRGSVRVKVKSSEMDGGDNCRAT